MLSVSLAIHVCRRFFLNLASGNAGVNNSRLLIVHWFSIFEAQGVLRAFRVLSKTRLVQFGSGVLSSALNLLWSNSQELRLEINYQICWKILKTISSQFGIYSCGQTGEEVVHKVQTVQSDRKSRALPTAPKLRTFREHPLSLRSIPAGQSYS